jgi:hypothetical protein
VGIDRPEDPDLPPDRPSDHRDDHGGGGRDGSTQVETRSRQEYYADLRVAAAEEESAAAQRAAAKDQAAAQKWDESSKESRWMWTEYQRKWPPEERTPVDKPADPAVNSRVEAECDRVAKREQDKISPPLRAIESQDQDRHLIGFEYRLKGRDRIKEKVHGMIKESNFTPDQAVSLVPDAIRYTFQYREDRYTKGIRVDIERLKEQGFKLDKLKNFWSDEQYKGINSQWIEPDSGQRFEVQFHTRISFEAKQLTHGAYERLRSQQADSFEELVLEAFQKRVTAAVPVPLGADSINDYPERGANA